MVCGPMASVIPQSWKFRCLFRFRVRLMSKCRPLVLVCHPPEQGLENPFFVRLEQRLADLGIDLAMLHTAKLDAVPSLAGRMKGKLKDWREAGESELLPPASDGGRMAVEASKCWVTADLKTHLTNSEAERASRWVETVCASALATYRPSLLLVWNGEHDVQVTLRHLALQCGVPVIRMERAPIPGFGYVSDDGLMGDASFTKKPIEWDDETQRRHWMSVWLELKAKLTQGNQTWYEQPESSGKLRERLDIADDTRLLLFAGQVDADTQNHLFSPYESNVAALQAIADAARVTEKCFIVGKHHPMSDTSASTYRKVLGDVGVWLEDASLPQMLEEVDAVVAVNSSVIFESAARGLPTMALGRTLIDAHGGFATWNPDDAPQSLQALLDRQSLETDAAAFDEAMAWLLSINLFAFAEERDDRSHGVEEVAERLSRLLRLDEIDFRPVLPGAGRVFEMLRQGARAQHQVQTLRRSRVFDIAIRLRARFRRAMSRRKVS